MSQIKSQMVQLSFLTEKEEEAILSVIQEDLELQKEEERRIKKLRDDIAIRLTLKCGNYGTRTETSGTFCAHCGALFGWIFDSGKMCQACSQWVCKRDRIHCSDSNLWICKLCHMELYINETTLSVSLDPSNVLCVSFNTRDGEAEQGFYYKQQNYLRPKEEIEQDYHNQEMFQQATGEESEEGKEDNGDDEDEVEQLNQQNIHKQNNPSAVSLALSSNNIQGICQQIWQDKRKEKETEQTQQQQSKKGQWKIEQKTTRNVVFSSNVEQLQENHSVPVPQDHRYPVTTGTPTRSPKRLAFNEKLTSFLQPIIPVATVRGLNPINNLDDDDDDDDDDNGVVDDVTRSSPEDGDETSDDDDNYCTSCQLKPILVCPGNDDGEETINLMFPKKSEKKASFELDDVDFRALTKQNTMRNRVSVTSLKSSDSHDDTSQSTDNGQLKVSLQFNITNDKKQIGDLVVTIISGHNLLQTELTCNPVMKCHLLPDYRKKIKTKVLKDSSDPEWNEQFVFDHLKLEDLRKNRVIELTVWNSTKNTKHYDFIGGLRLGPRPHHKKQLSYMDSSENELSHWMSAVNTPGECVEQLHTLRHKMDPLPVTLAADETLDDAEDTEYTPRSDSFVLTHPDETDTNQLPMITGDDDDNIPHVSQQTVPSHAGDIRVMIQFDGKNDEKNPKKKIKGCLNVCIQQARQLNLSHGEETFIQCSLLPQNKKESFKSEVVQGGDSPCYTVNFQFDKVTDVELSYDRVLEITIWEPHRNANEFVGGIRLGPKPQPGNKNKWMDSVGSEVSQWEMMMARPEEWIDEWHLLHSLMKPVVVPA